MGAHALTVRIRTEVGVQVLTFQPAENLLGAKWNHFSWERELAEGGHHFALIDNPNVPATGGGNHLLERVRSTATFNALEVFVDFIRPVDAQVDVVDIINVFHRDAQRARLFGRATACGNCLDVQILVVNPAGNCFNEEKYRGAGT